MIDDDCQEKIKDIHCQTGTCHWYMQSQKNNGRRTLLLRYLQPGQPEEGGGGIGLCVSILVMSNLIQSSRLTNNTKHLDIELNLKHRQEVMGVGWD